MNKQSSLSDAIDSLGSVLPNPYWTLVGGATGAGLGYLLSPRQKANQKKRRILQTLMGAAGGAAAGTALGAAYTNATNKLQQEQEQAKLDHISTMLSRSAEEHQEAGTKAPTLPTVKELEEIWGKPDEFREVEGFDYPMGYKSDAEFVAPYRLSAGIGPEIGEEEGLEFLADHDNWAKLKSAFPDLVPGQELDLAHLADDPESAMKAYNMLAGSLAESIPYYDEELGKNILIPRYAHAQVESQLPGVVNDTPRYDDMGKYIRAMRYIQSDARPAVVAGANETLDTMLLGRPSDPYKFDPFLEQREFSQAAGGSVNPIASLVDYYLPLANYNPAGLANRLMGYGDLVSPEQSRDVSNWIERNLPWEVGETARGRTMAFGDGLSLGLGRLVHGPNSNLTRTTNMFNEKHPLAHLAGNVAAYITPFGRIKGLLGTPGRSMNLHKLLMYPLRRIKNRALGKTLRVGTAVGVPIGGHTAIESVASKNWVPGMPPQELFDRTTGTYRNPYELAGRF